MKNWNPLKVVPALLAALVLPSLAGLESGDAVQVTLRGVPAAEQEKVNGVYRVGESGGVRLPFLDKPVPARGLSAEQLARRAEAAYRDSEVYADPAIEIEALQGNEQAGEVAVVSVGGQVRRAGETKFRKGMTVIQAIDAAGGRNEFGGRNVLLLRGGKQYVLDFAKLRHKNIALRPDDSLQVEQKGIVDRWRGDGKAVEELFE